MKGIFLGYFFYNVAFVIVSLCVVPVSLLKILFSKSSLHRERWGFYSPQVLQKLGQRPSIWVHAASVGEVRVALSLLTEMRSIYPHHGFVVSTTTPQGRAIASHAQGVDAAFLAPLDLPWVVRRTVKRIRVRLLVVTETELWPNLLREVKKTGVPIILFNGRLSSRSYRLYRPLRFFFRGVLRHFDVLCLKSSVDKERMVSLGADQNTIQVTGDLKFHQQVISTTTDAERLRRELGLSTEATVLIAGSTHEPEEEIVLQIFRELRATFPQLILILAPRHVQRVPRVEGLLESQGIRGVRRTMIGEGRRSAEVIVLDTVGELAGLYGLGTAIFVGGSFCRVGGHNILEVVAHGKGVIFGPYMENFTDIARLVLERGAGIQVSTPTELKEAVEKFLADPSLNNKMGEQGLVLLQEQQGALERTLKIVREFFKE
jgi:3-deoxy-D-manno-octulosonic-acid transferase